MEKDNLEFKDKIVIALFNWERKAYVILTVGDSKKSAGFISFDLGNILNKKTKDHHFDLPLT